ncbi:MAG: chemosensory pili system protein ChpC [Lentisphaeria bacterium]|jgi:chemosensory pili system protein ChpC
MSNDRLRHNSAIQEIPCFLVTMGESTLLLPTTAVAEMVSIKPLEAIAGAPVWLAGMYDWRNLKVPVISLEVLNGEIEEAVLNVKGRIAVLNSTGVDEAVSFVAIHTQGIPRMTRVSEQDIVENEEAQRKHFDLLRVKVGLEEFVIPDIPSLESLYLSYLQSTEAGS